MQRKNPRAGGAGASVLPLACEGGNLSTPSLIPQLKALSTSTNAQTSAANRKPAPLVNSLSTANLIFSDIAEFESVLEDEFAGPIIARHLGLAA
jgi:hypothetical protein